MALTIYESPEFINSIRRHIVGIGGNYANLDEDGEPVDAAMHLGQGLKDGKALPNLCLVVFQSRRRRDEWRALAGTEEAIRFFVIERDVLRVESREIHPPECSRRTTV